MTFFRYVSASALLLLLPSCNKDNEVVEPVDPTMAHFRPAVAASSPFQTTVFDYTPAPGQFINDTQTGGFTEDITTPEAACRYAKERLANRQFVSLGAFGGYIVVGFDHSIARNEAGKYDFAIEGNAFVATSGTSNEPGVVWVSYDENGNSLPDDTWYQLSGSETGTANATENYSVTYYRPVADEQPVEWVASDGSKGQVEYLKNYHKQPTYFPAWVSGESYTLTGTLLKARNHLVAELGNWVTEPYDCGYADNIGTDAVSDYDGQWTGFNIDYAIDAKGEAVKLPFVDFIKVQSAVMAQSGWIGEVSTEVLSVRDCSL